MKGKNVKWKIKFLCCCIGYFCWKYFKIFGWCFLKSESKMKIGVYAFWFLNDKREKFEVKIFDWMLKENCCYVGWKVVKIKWKVG